VLVAQRTGYELSLVVPFFPLCLLKRDNVGLLRFQKTGDSIEAVFRMRRDAQRVRAALRQGATVPAAKAIATPMAAALSKMSTTPRRSGSSSTSAPASTAYCHG